MTIVTRMSHGFDIRSPLGYSFAQQHQSTPNTEKISFKLSPRHRPTADQHPTPPPTQRYLLKPLPMTHHHPSPSFPSFIDLENIAARTLVSIYEDDHAKFHQPLPYGWDHHIEYGVAIMWLVNIQPLLGGPDSDRYTRLIEVLGPGERISAGQIREFVRRTFYRVGQRGGWDEFVRFWMPC